MTLVRKSLRAVRVKYEEPENGIGKRILATE